MQKQRNVVRQFKGKEQGLGGQNLKTCGIFLFFCLQPYLTQIYQETDKMRQYKSPNTTAQISLTAKFLRSPTNKHMGSLHVLHPLQTDVPANNSKEGFNHNKSLQGTNCRSFPHLPNASNYIKVNPEDAQKYNILANKSVASPTSTTRKLKSPNLKSQNGQNQALEAVPTEIETRQPKFFRKNIDQTSPRAVRLHQKIVSQLKMNNNECHQKQLMKIIEQKDAIIGQLQLKVKKLQQNINILNMTVRKKQEQIVKKDKKIESLEYHIELSGEEKRQLTQKFQELICQQGIFKNNTNISLPDIGEGISLQLATTAEHIESISDLQEQIHHKNQQIFALKQVIEKMKIKFHFTELRNNENIKKINEDWNKKHKALLQNYKTLKSSYASKALPPQTPKLGKSQSIFNLSLSLEQSQTLQAN